MNTFCEVGVAEAHGAELRRWPHLPAISLLGEDSYLITVMATTTTDKLKAWGETLFNEQQCPVTLEGRSVVPAQGQHRVTACQLSHPDELIHLFD